MVHWSENSKTLQIQYATIHDTRSLLDKANYCSDVCLLILPSGDPCDASQRLNKIYDLTSELCCLLGPDATLVVIGEVVDLVDVHQALNGIIHYQHWIAIKRACPKTSPVTALPSYHFGALIYTRYEGGLRHTKTRMQYTYCPSCKKTTKDYGGKKHTYHRYGTLISDVWRDVPSDLDGNLDPLIGRFADLFGIDAYNQLRVLDCRLLPIPRRAIKKKVLAFTNKSKNRQQPTKIEPNSLVAGGCLEELSKIEQNSVDFAFADPPYNLGKKYSSYSDNVEITKYFDWCDKWISELARVLKPGRTVAILNIPLWSVRHFRHMEKILKFQNWIVWEALSFPVRMIMPSHYTILCFSKGAARPLSLDQRSTQKSITLFPREIDNCLQPLAEGYCLRSSCIESRGKNRLNDRGPLTDLWWDIHRLKHNTRRVDHPCQVPAKLMYRLISIFTEPGETLLDCFNGAGTSTLAAHLLGRKYIGIEVSQEYHSLAKARHDEVCRGLDPFRKADRMLTSKNSPVRRLPKRKYAIPKKTLQLEVKRVSQKLRHLPTRDELARFGKYPIEYYDSYFISWGEVCAAARTTGMSEIAQEQTKHTANVNESRLF